MTTRMAKAERTHMKRAGTVSMKLPADQAFLLFDPEGEKRWVAGWEPRYVHPTHPSVREGVVFQTTTGEGTATWVQTRYDPAAKAASYAYVVSGHRATMVDVTVASTAEGHSEAHVTYRMTALSPEADDFVQDFGDSFSQYLVQWEEAIQKHILEGVPLV